MFPEPTPQQIRAEEATSSLHLMTTASTPATPGPSTPTSVRPIPIDQLKIEDHGEEIIPPARPKSTPFPEADMIEGNIQCLLRLNDGDRIDDVSRSLLPAPSTTSHLCGMPLEIDDCILDHLLGQRSSTASRTMGSGKTKILRSWGTALRHSRRKEVARLSLVSKKWRHLVQDRLYRHLKVKGTRESVAQAVEWFQAHPHLCPYVKHIEIWFPVFQQKNPAFDRTLRVATPSTSRALPSPADNSNSVTYQSPSNNCTLEEIFRFVQMTLGEACILTLEGGDRKKPPQVQHFLNGQLTVGSGRLPEIPGIKTLVCKGQWNLIRCNGDFQNISRALPNLNEWHGLFAKPKSKSYISMAAILPNLGRNLTHLNLVMENDYRREAASPMFVKKVAARTHFCIEMAKAIPTLEHLAFTGRLCKCFFDHAAKLSDARTSRMRSVDLIVKNICRPTYVWNDGTGITDMPFIQAFEALVLSAVKSLDKMAALEFLRIRFIDLGKFKSMRSENYVLIRSRIPSACSESIFRATE
jgi:hypothetical protein